ncbi:MAG: GspH/FimT family pseudopilin [Armatimonadetes bacterium]|nr:GspH/FimT family pseudopilin [Armatimonadota bacterium]
MLSAIPTNGIITPHAQRPRPMPTAQRSTPNAQRSNQGFTLIEVIVVLMFMVIAAAIIMPRFSQFQRAGHARDTARNVMALVREARELAVETQRTVALEADPSTRSLVLRFEDAAMTAQNSPGTRVLSFGGNNTLETPRPPVTYPEPLVVEMQTTGTSLDPASNTQILFTPEGRVSDADFAIQYAADRALYVTVRRQGTRVRVEDPDEYAASSL